MQTIIIYFVIVTKQLHWQISFKKSLRAKVDDVILTKFFQESDFSTREVVAIIVVKKSPSVNIFLLPFKIIPTPQIPTS